MGLILVIAAVIMLAYLWSLKRHPYRSCRHCGGSKNHLDKNWQGAFGRCIWCSRTPGIRIRWGVRLLMRGTCRDIRAGNRGKYY
jgi:hypothetical protein